jgi:hypothetical protein
MRRIATDVAQGKTAGLLPRAASSFFSVTWFRSASYNQNFSPLPTINCSYGFWYDQRNLPGRTNCIVPETNWMRLPFLSSSS